MDMIAGLLQAHTTTRVTTAASTALGTTLDMTTATDLLHLRTTDKRRLRKAIMEDRLLRTGHHPRLPRLETRMTEMRFGDCLALWIKIVCWTFQHVPWNKTNQLQGVGT